uniref:CRAL-TRIO domain-containing protein n=1 Tax=Timema monikensis TaxID=170555 RepID=A0A7R9E193_9NEOP|nr:unnamed protein product [Timema monikensis]
MKDIPETAPKCRQPFKNGLPESDIDSGRAELIYQLKTWHSSQTHLPPLTGPVGREFDMSALVTVHVGTSQGLWAASLTCLLYCYDSVEKTKKTIEAYFTFRTVSKDLFSNRDSLSPEIQDFLNISNMVQLPRNTPEGYKVLFYRLTDMDPLKLFFLPSIKAFLMFNDMILSENGLKPGYVVIFDMKDHTLGHLARVTLPLIRKLMYYIQLWKQSPRPEVSLTRRRRTLGCSNYQPLSVDNPNVIGYLGGEKPTISCLQQRRSGLPAPTHWVSFGGKMLVPEGLSCSDDNEHPNIHLTLPPLKHRQLLCDLKCRYMICSCIECHPARLKGVHIINSVPFMDKVLMLIKPFMKSEMIKMAAPPTPWTAPQSMFSKPSVTSSPLYSVPMITPLSIGSLAGHYRSRFTAPMRSSLFSHWTRPGSSGGYLARWFPEEFCLNSLSFRRHPLTPTATHVAGTLFYLIPRLYPTSHHDSRCWDSLSYLPPSTAAYIARTLSYLPLRLTLPGLYPTSPRDSRYRDPILPPTTIAVAGTSILPPHLRTSFCSTTTNIAGTISPTFFLPLPTWVGTQRRHRDINQLPPKPQRGITTFYYQVFVKPSILHIHGPVESLEPFLPLEMLPEEYGGKAGSIIQLNDKHRKQLETDFSSWLKEEEQLRVDESRRPTDQASKPHEMFGIDGSFRRLDID